MTQHLNRVGKSHVSNDTMIALCTLAVCEYNAGMIGCLHSVTSKSMFAQSGTMQTYIITASQ